MKPRLAGALALCLCLLAAGCAKGPDFKYVPVSGKITVGSEPLASGQVSFFLDPPPSDSLKVGLVAGQVQNGEYKVFSKGKEGAPEGKYKVVVTPSMVPQPGAKGPPTVPFDKKYMDAKTTTLSVTVPGSSYDLKLDKASGS